MMMYICDPFWRLVRVVEGARLESVYTGNCIKGSNPLVSAEISYFNEGEIKKPSKIKGFKDFCFLSLPNIYSILLLFRLSDSWSLTLL